MQIGTMQNNCLGSFRTKAAFKEKFAFNKLLTVESQLTNAELFINRTTYLVRLHANEVTVSKKPIRNDASLKKKLKDRFTDHSNTIADVLHQKVERHSPFLHPLKREGQKYLRYFDTIISRPDIYVTIESAKNALKEEYTRQREMIDKLDVQPKYEQLDSTGSPIIGSQKNRFHHDLNTWLKQSQAAIEKKNAHIPTTCEGALINIRSLGIYRERSVRTPNPVQPVPSFPMFAGVESNQGQGGVETQLCSLFFSGIMHYDIYKPLTKEDAAMKCEDGKTKNWHQQQWQLFHSDIITNSSPFKRIEIRDSIRSTFHQGKNGQDWVDFSGVYSTKSASLFEGSILCHTKPLPTGSRDEQLATLEEQISSNWRCCRLKAHDPDQGQFFINLVQEDDGKIRTINHPKDTNGVVFKNKTAFYQLFVDPQPLREGISPIEVDLHEECLGFINKGAEQVLFENLSTPQNPNELVFIN